MDWAQYYAQLSAMAKAALMYLSMISWTVPSSLSSFRAWFSASNMAVLPFLTPMA